MFPGCPLEHLCVSENGWNNKTPINCNFTGKHFGINKWFQAASFSNKAVLSRIDFWLRPCATAKGTISPSESGWTKELTSDFCFTSAYLALPICLQNDLKIRCPSLSRFSLLHRFANGCVSEWGLQRWQVNKEHHYSNKLNHTNMWTGPWWGRVAYPLQKKQV